MEFRRLGNTDLRVSRLGLGLARIDRFTVDDVQIASHLLNTALDNGINFIDTAAKYGVAEELIGLTVSKRRNDYVLASKFGAPWAYADASASIENSLCLMKTDHIDLMQIHSADMDTLQSGEIIRAPTDAKDSGKVRYIGYAGDNQAASWAVSSGVFDTVQTSFNLADQAALKQLLPNAMAANMGVIAKRPIANSAWAGPPGHASTTAQFSRLQERCRAMQELGPITGLPADSIELALMFTLAHEAVDTAIAGTTSAQHLLHNIHVAEHAPGLAMSVVEELHMRFDQLGADWPQLT